MIRPLVGPIPEKLVLQVPIVPMYFNPIEVSRKSVFRSLPELINNPGAQTYESQLQHADGSIHDGKLANYITSASIMALAPCNVSSAG